MRINVFYHIFLTEGVESIVLDQIRLLSEKCSEFDIYVNINDVYSGRYSLSEETMDDIKRLAEEVTFCNEMTYEMSTLSLLYNHALKNDGYYLYIHTKGASKAILKGNPIYGYFYENIENWRKMMEHFCIENSALCIGGLQTHDIVGSNYYRKTDKIPAHFSGNFWWAKSEFIRRLPDISKMENNHGRYLAEFWIGMLPHRGLCIGSVHGDGPEMWPTPKKLQENINKIFMEEVTNI